MPRKISLTVGGLVPTSAQEGHASGATGQVMTTTCRRAGKPSQEQAKGDEDVPASASDDARARDGGATTRRARAGDESSA